MTMHTDDRIVVEIDERISVPDAEQFEAYCSDCKKMRQMVTPKTVSVLTGITEREVFRMIEEAEVHFIENARVLVCMESVRNRPAHFSTPAK